MNVSVDFKGVEEHIHLLENEKKKATLLIEQLEMYLQSEQMNFSNQTIKLKNNIDDLKRLKRSIENRIDFLNHLVIDGFRLLRNIDQAIKDIPQLDEDK